LLKPAGYMLAHGGIEVMLIHLSMKLDRGNAY
jgi:hypothetical protein